MQNKKQIEADILRVTKETKSYYPGGSGGGGSRRKTSGGSIILPHVRTSPHCTLCNRYHSQEEHARHMKSMYASAGFAGVKVPAVASRATSAAKKPAAKKTAANKPAAKKTAAKPVEKFDRASKEFLDRRERTEITDQDERNALKKAKPETIDVVTNAVKKIHGNGRFGPDKVFISETWKATRNKTKLTLNEFKAWLIPQNRVGNLSLARADLPTAMDPKKVHDSETHNFGATFHFILDRPPRTRR